MTTTTCGTCGGSIRHTGGRGRPAVYCSPPCKAVGVHLGRLARAIEAVEWTPASRKAFRGELFHSVVNVEALRPPVDVDARRAYGSELRDRRGGMSQTALAQAAGIRRGRLSQIETGDRPASADERARLDAALVSAAA